MKPHAATCAAHRDTTHVAAARTAGKTGRARVGLNAGDKEKEQKESPAERQRRKEKGEEVAKKKRRKVEGRRTEAIPPTA